MSLHPVVLTDIRLDLVHLDNHLPVITLHLFLDHIASSSITATFNTGLALSVYLLL